MGKKLVLRVLPDRSAEALRCTRCPSLDWGCACPLSCLIGLGGIQTRMHACTMPVPSLSQPPFPPLTHPRRRPSCVRYLQRPLQRHRPCTSPPRFSPTVSLNGCGKLWEGFAASAARARSLLTSHPRGPSESGVKMRGAQNSTSKRAPQTVRSRKHAQIDPGP